MEVILNINPAINRHLLSDTADHLSKILWSRSTPLTSCLGVHSTVTNLIEFQFIIFSHTLNGEEGESCDK